MALLPSAAEALPRKLAPIDECRSDPSLTTFRAALVDIAKREDTQALIANFAPSVPGDKPPDQNQYIPTEDWAILRGILRMGCVGDGSERVMPSVSAQLKRYGDQSLKNKLVVLPGAKLYGEPYEEKSVTATLGWDVGTAVGTGGDSWTGIRFSDGRKGWVSDEEIYWLDPSFRYEVTFAKRGGKWVITDIWLIR